MMSLEVLLLTCLADLSTGDQESIRAHLNLSLNCLLATRQNDNNSPGPGPGRLVPSSHQ